VREVRPKEIVVWFKGLKKSRYINPRTYAVLFHRGGVIEFTEDYCFYEWESIEEMIRHDLEQELRYWKGRLREVLFDVECGFLDPNAMVVRDVKISLAEALLALEKFAREQYIITVEDWEGW